MSKTILITGGAGFIGSNFVHYMLQHHPDYRIFVVDQLTYAGNIDNLPEILVRAEESEVPHRFWYGNVCNAELINSLVSESNMVVHFAAESHVTRSIYDNHLFFQTDVMGSQTIANSLLKSGKHVDRFIHISTSEVYGTARQETMDEEHPLLPMSPYASAKCGADRLVYSYWQTYGIPAVIVRPFNNFGPSQHLEKLVPRFITSGLLDEPMTVHGDGKAARDFVFVKDLCRALDLILHAPGEKVLGEVFNVASGKHRSILEVARDIQRIMNLKNDRIQFIGNRPGQVFRHTGNYAKIQERLGWSPATSWEEGLQESIEWFASNRKFWEKQMWMRTVPIMTTSGTIEPH